MQRFFRGGAAVPHRKTTSECQTVAMPVPDKVVIPLLQHIGALCEPKVQKGDQVLVGQIIGDSDKSTSAPIHSSVSGTVVNVDYLLWAGGTQVTSVEIQTDKQQQVHPSIKPPMIQSKADFLVAVRSSGLVGLGGAGFPAHVKLSPPIDRPIDTLIINAAECEPYITSDYREILENSPNVLMGIQAVMKHLHIGRCVIGIENNKPKAIEILKKLSAGFAEIEVLSLPSRYPQGAEKMLIFATTKRKVPAGKLPSDVGVIVMNVTTVSFLAEFLKTGMPLIKKKVTVSGPCVKNPLNVEVLIGTSLKEVFEFAGGFVSEPRKVVMGGPMMGVAQHSLETNVVKQTNALLAFPEKEGDLPESGPCIRCGRCVQACPMGLLPLELNRAALKNNAETLGKLSVNSCIECGSCAYVCPSKIQLVQAIRLGKTQARIASIKAASKQGVPG